MVKMGTDYIPLKLKVFEHLPCDSEDGLAFVECTKNFFIKCIADDCIQQTENCLLLLQSLCVTHDGTLNEIIIKEEHTDDDFDNERNDYNLKIKISTKTLNRTRKKKKKIIKNDEHNSTDTESYEETSFDPDFKVSDSETGETKDEGEDRKRKKVKKEKPRKPYTKRPFIVSPDLYDSNYDIKKCGSCLKYLYDNDALDKHIEEKHDNKTFLCDLCSERFYEQGEILSHRRDIHFVTTPDETLPYIRICQKCDVTHSSEEQWLDHSCIQYDVDLYKSERFRCHKCDDTPVFESTDKLRKHSNEVHGSTRITHKCDICEQEFKLKNATVKYLKHSQVHISELQKYQCGICDLEVKNHDILIKHFSKHTEYPPFNCKRCKKGYKSYSGISCHVRREDCPLQGSFPMACTICGEGSFKTNHQMRFHIDSEHLKSPRYQCEQCPDAFYDRSKLTQHMKKHSNQRDFVCDVCGKSFKFRPNLRKHKVVHQEDRPFTCPICGLTFKLSCRLIMHKKLHSTERNFLCHICTHPFKTRAALKRHIGTHNGERTHVCDECGKKFLRIYNLQVHQRIHTGEKPYKCGECSRAFSQVTGLRSHSCSRTRLIMDHGPRQPSAAKRVDHKEVPPVSIGELNMDLSYRLLDAKGNVVDHKKVPPIGHVNMDLSYRLLDNVGTFSGHSASHSSVHSSVHSSIHGSNHSQSLSPGHSTIHDHSVAHSSVHTSVDSGHSSYTHSLHHRPMTSQQTGQISPMPVDMTHYSSMSLGYLAGDFRHPMNRP